MGLSDVPDIAAADSKVCVGAASSQIAQSVLVVGDGIKGKTVSVSVVLEAIVSGEMCF